MKSTKYAIFVLILYISANVQALIGDDNFLALKVSDCNPPDFYCEDQCCYSAVANTCCHILPLSRSICWNSKVSPCPA